MFGGVVDVSIGLRWMVDVFEVGWRRDGWCWSLYWLVLVSSGVGLCWLVMVLVGACWCWLVLALVCDGVTWCWLVQGWFVLVLVGVS